MSSAPTLVAGDVSAASPVEADLPAYLVGLQDRLVEQAIAVAKTYGYAQYTTTIRAAWVEAIETLTTSFGDYLASPLAVGAGLHAEADYLRDPRFQRLRDNAKRHRSMGVTLQLYVGLFKHFRNLYLDAVGQLPAGPNVRALARDQMAAFFDAAELSIVSDWAEDSEDERLQELQARARSITLDKDRYFSVFESLRDPALLLDRQRQLVNANQAAAVLFVDQAGAGEIVYLRSTRVPMAELEALLAKAEAALKSDTPSIWLDTPKGRKCFDVGERTIHDAVGNMTLGHVVILHDVTPHRLATEEAVRAERAMSHFLATMSHEIRSPLHAVLGATELLRDAEEEEHLTYVDAIESAGRTLLGTLNNVLDYSKFEARPPQASPKPCELRVILDDYAGVARIWANQRQVPLSLKVSGQVPRFAAIDWQLTQQVLTNLVTNAIRFDPGTGVTIAISRRVRSPGETFLHFDVADGGPGVAAENLDLLFQPFAYRSRNASSNSGSGLGLAISQRLVGAMGGAIGYKSRQQGALFWFEVPYRRISASQAQHQAAIGAPSPKPQQEARRRCLLVDDDPVGIMITAEQLRGKGLEVTTANSANAAQDVAAESAFDVFVVDYFLGDGNGADLAATLKQKDGSSKKARYIALTANADRLAEMEDGGSPFHVTLSKPATGEELLAAIEGTAPPSVSNHAFSSSSEAALLGVPGKVKEAMAREFSSGWPAGVERLEACLQRGDREGLAAIAHRLAGSCAVMGLADTAALLRQLEVACQSGEQRLDCAAWRSSLGSLLRDAPQRALAIAAVAGA